MSREAPPATQPNTPPSMDAIAQIQGVQDIIISKLPINSLSIIGKTSSKWEAPTKEISIVKVQEEILVFKKRVSNWLSQRGRDWRLVPRVRVRGEKTPILLNDFIMKNKIGGIQEFKKLKKQFLEEVALEEWKLTDPRSRHRHQPPIVNVIHRDGRSYFNYRIKIEETKQEILTLLQFIFPEGMEFIKEKVVAFIRGQTVQIMVKNLRKILHCIPHAKIRTLLD
jgi:hypothetical protein